METLQNSNSSSNSRARGHFDRGGGDGFVVEVGVGHVDLDAHDVEVVEAARGGGTLEAPDGIAEVFIDEGAAAGAGVRSLDRHRPWTLGASNTVPRSTGVAACIGGPSEADTCRPRNPAGGAVPGRVAGTVSGGADPALAVAGGLLRCFEGPKELTWVVSRGAIRRRARGLVSSGAWEAEIGNDYLDSWHSHLRARERGERREGRQQGQRGEERCRSAFG